MIAWREDATTSRAAYRQGEDGGIQPRLHVLRLLREGYAPGETAQLIGVHDVTLQRWIAR